MPKPNLTRVLLALFMLGLLIASMTLIYFYSAGRKRSVAAQRLAALDAQVAFKNVGAGWFRDIVGDIVGDPYVHPCQLVSVREPIAGTDYLIFWTMAASLSPIDKVDVRQNELTRAFFESIAFSEINQIWIEGCSVSPDARICFPQSVRVLVIENTVLMENSLGLLQNLSLLEELWLDKTEVNVEDLTSVSLPRLSVLSIIGVDYIDPIVLTSIFPSLQTLYVDRALWTEKEEADFESLSTINVVRTSE